MTSSKLPAHSVLSASASSRWTQCPGSVQLSLGQPDTTSYAALEGTALHAVMEKCLLEKIDAVDVDQISIQEDGKTHHFDLTEEQHEAVQFVLDHARGLVEPDGTLMTEIKVLYGSVINQPDEEAFGTVDVAIVNGSHLHIMDAKFGRRFVDPNDNTQMLLYALGMLDTVELLEGRMEKVTMHISQPRIRVDEPLPGVELNREDFDEWEKFFSDAAAKVAQSRKEPFSAEWQEKYLNPSEEACHFCRGAAHCPALRKVFTDTQATAQKAVDPEDFEVIVTDKIPEEDLGSILDSAPLVERFLDAVKSKAMADLLDGKPVTGYKLVQGRLGNRKWQDEDAVQDAFEALGDERFQPSKLRSPAQMATALRKARGLTKAEADEQVSPLTVRDPAKPSVVPESQPGKPWSAEADFEIVK